MKAALLFSVSMLIASTGVANAHSSQVPGQDIDQLLLNKLYDTVDEPFPQYAVCWMEAHGSGWNVTGYIRFSQRNALGTLITGRIEGLTPNGLHAYHIHELGDLSDGCTSLSSHFDPFEEDHGGPDSCHRHVGDLGNLQADENGVAVINQIDHKI